MNEQDGIAGRWPRRSSATLASVGEPTVVEVLRVEEPAAGEGRRRVMVRWSDGSTGHALSYFPDEILVSEGDMIGKTVKHELAIAYGDRRDVTS